MVETNTSIDSKIGELLTFNYNGWQKKRLYAWNWWPISDRLKPEKLYDLNKFNLKNSDYSSLFSGPFIGITEIKIYDRERETLFGKKKDILLDLLVKRNVTGHSYHMVVTNMCPNVDLFGKNVLYTGIGNWDKPYK